MRKNLLHKIKTFWVENYKFLLAIVLIFALFMIELPYKIYAPGGMVDLSERVSVEEGQEYDGTLGMAYVSMVKGSIPYLLLSYVIPDWDIVSESELKYDNETMEEKIEADKISTEQSIDSAIIAAYRLAGKEIEIESENVHITYIDEQANTDLEILDVVKSVNGVEVKSTEELKSLIQNYAAGEEVEFLVERDGKERECHATLYDTDDGVKVGVALTVTYNYQEEPEASITMKQSESGPSGGLMMSLAIYNSLVDEDITKGKTVVGTGTIDIDGNVGAIGGVKYKLIGAVKNKADVFLVPKDNYEEAIEVKNEKGYEITILAVDTLSDAIESLESLD